MPETCTFPGCKEKVKGDFVIKDSPDSKEFRLALCAWHLLMSYALFVHLEKKGLKMVRKEEFK